MEGAREAPEDGGQAGEGQEVATGEVLDGGRAVALITASFRAGEALARPWKRRTGVAHWLETWRDRVVHRSQVWKGKLDATLTRRQLDTKLVALGEKFLLLAREGRAAVPPELREAFTEARDLEDRLQGQLEEVAALRSEVA